MLEQKLVDTGLGDARLSAALADRDDERGRTGEVEDLVGDEVVWKDDVGGLEKVAARRVRSAGSPGPAPTR